MYKKIKTALQTAGLAALLSTGCASNPTRTSNYNREPIRTTYKPLSAPEPDRHVVMYRNRDNEDSMSELDSFVEAMRNLYNNKIRELESSTDNDVAQQMINIIQPHSRELQGANFSAYSQNQRHILSEIITNYGWAVKEQGNRDQAISLYTRAIHLDPRNPSPVFNRAMSHYANKDLESCLEDLEEANRLRPGDQKIEKSIRSVRRKISRS